MKNKTIFTICLIISTCLPTIHATLSLPNIPATQYLITDYGADTASADNSAAINAAITAANTAGGGTVVIPAGRFLSGPITMQSDVNLFISAGATLQMMPYGNGNGSPAGSYPNDGTTDSYAYFIYGVNLSNIEVSGTGTIEGDGTAWWAAYKANSSIHRPYLIRFKACHTVLIKDITLQNSPNVHICLGRSSSMGSDGTISNVTILAPSNSPNTDAIDTWYWDGVDIENCHLATGDDNVAMDSYSHNITIKNCTMGTGHGISVGSYAVDVQNITVDSCTFDGTTNGIRLKSNRTRGGRDSTFSYSNITMNNVKYPFYITSWYDKEPYPASAQTAATITSTTPLWKNITFRNIVVTNSPNVGIIYGLPEMYVNNVIFDSVQISATSKGLIANFIKGMVFEHCSSITLPSGKGDAIAPYDADISGINITSGASTSCGDTTGQGNGSDTTSAINTVKAPGLVSCFPDPLTGDYFTINADNGINKVCIYNLAGVKIREQNGNLLTQLTVNVKGLPAGYYIVSVLSGKSEVKTLKLVKK